MSKKIKLDRNAVSKYSLHDARVKKIKISDNKLIFKLDAIYSYDENLGEIVNRGSIVFEKNKWDLDCEVFVFDGDLYGKKTKFKCKKYKLKKFLKKYKDFEFEIFSEGHSGYNTMLRGSLFLEDGKHREAIFFIWNDGDVFYKLGERL